MDIIRHGVSQPSTLQSKEITEARKEFGIPEDTLVSVSPIWAQTNFSYFCTDEVMQNGGALLYLDWYNDMVNQTTSYSKNLTSTLKSIKDFEYTMYVERGDYEICLEG